MFSGLTVLYDFNALIQKEVHEFVVLFRTSYMKYFFMFIFYVVLRV